MTILTTQDIILKLAFTRVWDTYDLGYTCFGIHMIWDTYVHNIEPLRLNQPP